MSQMGTYTEVSKLVGAGAVSQTVQQGFSVKLSEDGNFLFIGGYKDNNYIGAVWFYEKINGVWTQKQKIVPTGYSGSPAFGTSIAVNPSMTTLIVGAENDNYYVGASFVFTFDGTTWTQQDKLVGTGVTGSYGSLQGMDVALSIDANTAIAGGSWDGSYVGAAWIFVRSGSAWSQQGSKLVGNDSSGSPRQGGAVALASDGNLAVVGGANDQNDIGAIWIFLRSGTSWNQAGSKITATDETGAGNFGASLALSGDDQTLVVGGNADNSNAGATWIFKRNGNTFTQFGNKLLGTGATSSAMQGISVSVNKLGTLAAVGAYGDSSYVGAVFVFYLDGTQYNQLGNKVVGNNAIGSAYQGISVSLDGSGSQILFGGSFDNGEIGAGWIYVNAAITNSPSAAPTTPTMSPSYSPSTQPSLEPTTQPSVGPTTQPSVGPTTQPSAGPTTQPSVGPTTQPSVGSTTQPSVGPTTQPSAGPTTQPSVRPSTQPSVGLTTQPSIGSTAQPSIFPSHVPSLKPTTKPARDTTAKPTTALSNTSSGAFLSIVTVIPVLICLCCALLYFFFRVYKKQVNKEGMEMRSWIHENKAEIALHGKNYNGEDNDDDDGLEVASMDNPLTQA